MEFSIILTGVSLAANFLLWLARTHDTTQQAQSKQELAQLRLELSDKILSTVNRKYAKTELLTAIVADIHFRIASVTALQAEVKHNLEHQIDAIKKDA
jgi:carboxylesterase type B